MRRITDTSFPVKHQTLRADGGLPFDTGRFDTVVTTWTLCSIADARAALGEMRRVLKPGGRYLFIEHGRAPSEGTARWQDRVNPLWNRIADGCNINRQIDRIVEDSGFELTSLDRFRGRGPGLFAHMFRGVATRQA
jgi:SAM-dependent methyltransferase